MRKFAAILFILILATTTEAGAQVVKFPLLLKHFYLHIHAGRSHSFTDFLLEHYTVGDHNDTDTQQDKQLPFKTINADSFSLIFISSGAIVPLFILPFAINRNVPGLTDFNIQDNLKGIFHPPRAMRQPAV